MAGMRASRALSTCIVIILLAPAWMAAQTPEAEVQQVNQLARSYYGHWKSSLASGASPVIWVIGNELRLYRNGTVAVHPVPSPEIDYMKTAGHTVALGMVGLLAETDGALPPERLEELARLRDGMVRVKALMPEFNLSEEVRRTHTEILDRGIAYCDRTLDARESRLAGFRSFLRSFEPLIDRSARQAAAMQIDILDRKVKEIRALLSPEEQQRLIVVVSGPQTPRAGQLHVQYFARELGLPGETPGRLIYAESLYTEEGVFELLGTHLADCRMSEMVFGDPNRMFRDLLSEGASEYLRAR